MVERAALPMSELPGTKHTLKDHLGEVKADAEGQFSEAHRLRLSSLPNLGKPFLDSYQHYMEISKLWETGTCQNPHSLPLRVKSCLGITHCNSTELTIARVQARLLESKCETEGVLPTSQSLRRALQFMYKLPHPVHPPGLALNTYYLVTLYNMLIWWAL